MDRVDCVVVGAGVVGLACARALAMAGREVIVLEGEAAFGTGTSSRNSEVIHAGIYYPPGSWRARLCVRGKELLYAFCASHHVAHKQLGKLIVAADEAERAGLARLQANAQACGVHDLQWLDAAGLRAMEPELRGQAALWSPSTGIVDSHGLMLALLGEAEAHGALLARASPVLGGELTGDGIVLRVGGAAPSELLARMVVNAAGHGAPVLAGALRGLAREQVPPRFFAKGCYFGLGGRAPFSHLVYPAPGESGHLGVHLTLDLGGQARFGPSFHWVQGLDFGIEPSLAGHFEQQIRRYWPGLPAGALQPGMVGVRPKIRGPGEPAQDFRLDGPAEHGVPGLVNLFGIESPGLTAAMAIGEQVASMLR